MLMEQEWAVGDMAETNQKTHTQSIMIYPEAAVAQVMKCSCNEITNQSLVFGN